MDVASIKPPGLAVRPPPLLSLGLTVDLECEVVPVDDPLPHSGVAPQQVVTVIVHQHVKHLAVASHLAIGLAPLQLQSRGNLGNYHRLHVLSTVNGAIASGAENKATGGVLPYLRHLPHTFHYEDLLRQQVAASVQSPDCWSSSISHELESSRSLPDVSGTDDVRAVHDAGPHPPVSSLSLAQHCRPQHGSGGDVQRHHRGGHHVTALLPQSPPGIQSAAALNN